jgi:hypothetical protein
MDKDTLFDSTFPSHGINDENWLSEQYSNGVVDGDAAFCGRRTRLLSGLKYFTTKRVAEDVAPLSGSDKYFLV